MKTYLDFNLEPIKKTIREIMKENEKKVSENKLNLLVTEMIQYGCDIKVSCLTCGIKYPLNNLAHDCQKEDIWLYEYIKCSKKKKIPRGCKTKLKKKYPLSKRNLMVFRGINFDTKEQYNAFMEQLKDGYYHFSDISSWTTDYKKAHNFARFIMKGTREDENMRGEALKEMVEKKANITGYKGIVLGTNLLKKMVLCDISNEGIGNMDEQEIVLLEGNHPVVVMTIIDKVEGLSNWDIDLKNLHEILQK